MFLSGLTRYNLLKSNRLTTSSLRRTTLRQSNASLSTKSYPKKSYKDYYDDEPTQSERNSAKFLNKKGRIWSDPWNVEQMIEAKTTFKSLPNWSADLVSRVSSERVQIYEDKIPTLDALSNLALPFGPPPHPGLDQAKAYALHRKREQYKYISKKVKAMAEDLIAPIQAIEDWDTKQNAVDELFEEIEFALKEREEILGKHPLFGKWVERSLEDYLRSLQKEEVTDDSDKQAEQATLDQDACPIFMDCFDNDMDSAKDVVPFILTPLKPNPRELQRGSMIEEWALSANKASKRIMLRQCTRRIARILATEMVAKPQRILVSGRQGVGKTAALCAIVASARKSGHIVLFLPDGDRLSKNGLFIEPNEKRSGIFDLPNLSQEVCDSFLKSHGKDLVNHLADKTIIDEYFTEDQQSMIPDYNSDSIPLLDLLRAGAEEEELAPMCYAVTVDVLMKQDATPFIIVADEFNCYFHNRHYYHEAYDVDVKKSIPYNQISLFKPFVDAMSLSAENSSSSNSNLMKRGAVIVATTESHAIPRKITDTLIENAKYHDEIHVVDVPRLSAQEVEHMLANYECTGVGKLRVDQGETVMNQKEVEYLRVVSGGVAQKLMDACME